MKNAHRLCGDESQTLSTPEALGSSRVEPKGSGCNYENKATQVNRRVVEPKRATLRRFLKAWWGPLNCEKDGCWWY